jgi:hypothetical protein
LSNSSYYNITLKLSNIKHLFQEPEFDPFVSQLNSIAGIEQIISELKPTSLKGQLRTTIILPANQLSENLEKSTIEALQCYCSVRIEQTNNDLLSLRGQGIRALQRGLLFLAICLLLSTLFDGLYNLPGLIRRFLSEGFLIAGWVSLWHPIELLLYEWGPYRRQQKIYQLIKDMDLKVMSRE